MADRDELLRYYEQELMHLRRMGTEFARKYPKAVPASACSGGGMEPVKLTDGGTPAVMFDIGPVKRDAGAITVEGGGGHRGGGSIREVQYTVERGPQGLRVANERVLRES